jgi:glycine betaine/proline transport system substrate-binding protein
MALIVFGRPSAAKLRSRRLTTAAVTWFLAVALSTGSAAAAQVPPVGEPASCQLVRLSDIGWTDVTATTALTSTLLRSLGYQTQVTLLSVPVTFASMRNKDIDVFMGNWMPSQVADRKPFDEDHSIDVIGANLTGAKYTLAVPAYTYEAGIKDFADIKRIGAELNHSIYGIEAGNDGNRHVLNLINKKQFGLGDFKLVESSEQGMLAEVDRAIAEHRPIVFLAWEPHPMNTRYHIKYLTGGDSEFGPDFGGTSVFTNTRAGYTQECPNVGRLLKNLKFTVSGEEELMSSILDTHGDPDTAAAAWLQAHPEVRSSWLEGVRAVDGTPALQPRAKREIVRNADQWIVDHKIPVGDFMARLIDVIKTHGKVFFRVVSMTIAGGVNGLTYVLNAIPSLWLVGVFMLLAWLPRRSWGLALFVGLALLFIINQGYWAATCETLSLVSLSALVSTLVGVPIGIAAAHRPRLYAALRPVLDLMQTLPTFVYLIPTLVLFGLGVVPGLISTVIFALPAPIRLTHLGISSVPVALREAGEAFGATRLQLLWKVELPSAAPSIMAGVTQCTMLCLSMVVIAALVGAGGLGVPVVRALNTVQVGTGFEAGFAIVLLAIVLDRISRSANRERK